jgi:hypothetical protein
MKRDLNNILGEEIIGEGDFSLHSKGVVYRGKYILWDNVDSVYVGGTKSSINFIPTYENRTIALVDETAHTRIDLSFSNIFRMGKGMKQLFNDLYSIILNNVSQRQWTKFIQALQAGERLNFQEFEMTREAFYFRKFFGGYKQIDVAQVRGYDTSLGYFYIQYQDNQKIKEQQAGEVSRIPNVHILQTFIDMITKCS